MNRRFFLSLLSSSWLVSMAPRAIAANSVDRKSPHKFDRAIVFYVSPQGNDRWNGTKPNKSGKNGPFATITRARDAIRKLKQQQGGGLKQPVKVILRGGTYFVSQTIEFTERDTGSQAAPIIYQAYKQEVPIISGGKILTQWQQIEVNGKIAWSTILPEIDRAKWVFHQLWVNGQRAQRCRSPKQGYFKVDRALDSPPEWTQGRTRFQYAPGDLQAWKNLEPGEIIIMSHWLESRLPITSIDPERRIVSYPEPTLLRIEAGNSQFSGAGIYYVENILELLTEPGEWYLDDKTGQLLYLPRKGEKIAKSQIIAPILAKLFTFTGDERSEKFVEHLTFEGLTFAHGEWYYPQPGRISQPQMRRVNLSGQQAAVNVPGYIYAQGMRSCSWKKCTFSRIGGYGLELTASCIDNRVVECKFYDLGAGGIKIGSTNLASDGKNLISKCQIYNGGILFHSAVGIWVGNSANNIIADNHIHDLYYTGISIGWTWGYGKDTNLHSPDAPNNIIENNHIHQLGKKANGDGAILNDKGGIYTLGLQPGTIIRGNSIHDIDAYNYGAFGIYLDEGSSQILVENNIVHNIRGSSFHLHYGRNNLVCNNIFAFANGSQILYSVSETAHRGLNFQNNIIYWRDGTLLAGSWQDLNFTFDRNIYWNPDKTRIKFDRRSWQEWRTAGMDLHSEVIDPLFIAPDRSDFRLQPNSPALKLGFKQQTI